MSEFEKDEDCISYALNLWANYIETGSVSLNQHDLIERLKACGDQDWNKGLKRELMDQLRNLTDDQKAFVLRLRKLAKEKS
jgi:hypothetical protein